MMSRAITNSRYIQVRAILSNVMLTTAAFLSSNFVPAPNFLLG